MMAKFSNWVRILCAIASVVALLGPSTSFAGLRPMSVEAFTISTIPIRNDGSASVYLLDGVAALEAYLSAKLPTDPARAQALVSQRMAQAGDRLLHQARNGSVGLSRAFQLGIQRAPAVVFDGRWVVYGVTDIAEAKRQFVAGVPVTRKE